MGKFAKFNEMFNVEELKHDVEEAAKNGGSGNYKEVPCGDYEVKVNKMELTESKKGDPMVSIWFKILAGEYEGSLIFYNQVIKQGFQLHLCNTLLKSFDTGLEIKFDDFDQYEQLILDVAEAIDTQKLEYGLKLGENKGFKTFEITEVFAPEN